MRFLQKTNNFSAFTVEISIFHLNLWLANLQSNIYSELSNN